MFLFEVPFSRIGIQSSNNSSVSPSQDSEVIYFAMKYEVVYFTQEVALSVVFCCLLTSLLCQQEPACLCAGPVSFPGAIHSHMSPAYHTKIDLISGQMRTYLQIA